MKETKHFTGSFYDALMFLQEHVTMKDEEGNQAWQLCEDNNLFPSVLYAGSLVQLNVEKCEKPPNIAEPEKVIKPPTKSQLIEMELITELGEEQIGAAKIVEPPKQRRQRATK